MKWTVHDLEAMGSSPSWVEIGVYSTSAKVTLEPKISTAGASVFYEPMHIHLRPLR